MRRTLTITVDGEEKRQNTLNSTSTNMIVTANIAPGKAVGGKAELYIGDSTTPVASDLSITSGDDIVTFDLETNTNAGLKTKIPAGGEVRVRLYNSVGNYTDSTANPLLIVDYDKPAAPSITSFIATGGTVYSGKLNSTNTNFTVSATIPAGQATGGKAELFIGNNRVRIVEPLLSTQSTVEFKVLDIASAYNLQSAIQEPGGEIKVKLYDSAGNYIFSSSNPSVSAKYSALSAPTKVSLSPIGGTVVANTLNSTNTNLTATAEIALGEAAGGKAELYIGSTKIAEDTSIGAYDTMVSFDCGAAAEFSLQSKIPNSGQISVKLYDSYGNFAESSGGPTLTVKYNRPTAPSNITVTPVGGIVVTNRLNATNTNLTATANITAGSATGGRAELYVGDTKIAEDTSIDALDTTVNFDCGATSTATLQNKIKYGGTILVRLYDAYGNYSEKAGDMLSVDYTNSPAAPQASRLHFNAAENKVYYEASINGSSNDGGTDPTRKLTLYMKVKRGTAVSEYRYNSGFANNNAGSFSFAVGTGAAKFTKISGDNIDSTFPMAGDALEYAVADSYGNMSNYTDDGTIPAAPVVSVVGLDNNDGKISIGATKITSSTDNTAIYVYYDNDGAGSSLTLHNYTALNTRHDGISTSYYATKKATWESIAAGKYLGYAIKDEASGNVSKLTCDGTIPAPPDVDKLAYSKAAKKTIISKGVVSGDNSTGCVLYCYQADNVSGSGLLSKGVKSGVNLTGYAGDLAANQDIAEDKFILYTFKNSAGNTSAYASDGKVPKAPTQAAVNDSSFSNASARYTLRQRLLRIL